MEKVKLRNLRIKKGFTQLDLSILANMDQSTDGRKENGDSKIYASEWKKFATVLDVPLKEIFEDEDTSVDICNDNTSNSNAVTNNSEYSSVPNNLIISLNNYIKLLEKEIKIKEIEIESLKSQIQKSKKEL
jgi:transcriptional regulator with XRE-family HTH domain